MKKVRYKPGKNISSYRNKNSYKQFYWLGGILRYKGYGKYGKHIHYQERHTNWYNKGIKYII